MPFITMNIICKPLPLVSVKMKMLTLQHKNLITQNNNLRGFANDFKKRGGGFFTIVSKRRDFPEKSKPILQIKVPNTTLARSAIAVLCLGFIDAGYSGDWSRIGVISKETEELLKIAAFVIVPLFIFLALSFSNESSAD